MHRKVTLTLLGVAAVSCLVFTCVHYYYGQPELFCEQMQYDFGEMSSGDTVSHSFVFRNVGRRRLEIQGVHSSCTCLSASVSKASLARDEEARLAVEFTVPSYRRTATGKVLLTTNDPDVPVSIFNVRAKASPVLELSPRGIDFGLPTYGRISDQPIALLAFCREANTLAAHVEDIVAPSPINVRVSYEEGTPRLLVWLAEDVPIGPLTGTVIVSAGSETVEQIDLTVRGKVTGPVRARPPAAVLGVVGPEKSGTARTEILAADPAGHIETSIVGVSGNIEQYTSATIVKEGMRTYLEVAWDPQAFESGESSCRGVVHLRCTGKIVAQLNVPVEFYARSR